MAPSRVSDGWNADATTETMVTLESLTVMDTAPVGTVPAWATSVALIDAVPVDTPVNPVPR